MSMFTEYWCEISGSPEDIASIRDGLSRGLVKMRTGSRDDFVLDPRKAHPGLNDESSEGVVGIDKLGPYPSTDGAYLGSTRDREVFESSADGSRMRFSGEATGMANVRLAERLSRIYPTVRIDFGDTTDHEVVERWTVMDGERFLVDHGAYTGAYHDHFEWFVQDGIRLDRPLEVHVGDGLSETLPEEQFVQEIDVASIEETRRG